MIVRLPPITEDYESDLIDKYTELYFELKEIQREEYIGIDFIRNSRRNRSRWDYRHSRIRKLERLHKRTIRLQKEEQLECIRRRCFNKRDSIIPPYYIQLLTVSEPDGYKACQSSYDKHITRVISDAIDCDLMDCNNISKLIYSYTKDTLVYSFFSRNNTHIIFTHVCHSSFVHSGGVYPIIKMEEVQRLPDETFAYFSIHPMHSTLDECDSSLCYICMANNRLMWRYTYYTDKNSILKEIKG